MGVVQNIGSLLTTDPRALFARKEYLLVASHMRSNSSVLSHVLGSNKEIWGYAELSLPYRSRLDLIKGRCKLYHWTGKSYDGRYLLDKVLHDRYPISKSLLEGSSSRIIILLRRPDLTIRSIINMGTTLDSIERYRNPEWVVDYYCKRLETLVQYSKEWQGQSCLIRSESIVDETESTLASLSEWLGLGEALTSSYEIFQYTGVPTYGDPSAVIKSGRIVKSSSCYDDVSVPKELLEKAENVYRGCLAELEKESVVI